MVEASGDHPVIIRTLDVGGDKTIGDENVKEDNSFMGFRAIRFCLGNEAIFKTQLRAILRSSAHGNVKIMYPMISGIMELRIANKVFDAVKQELRDEGRVMLVSTHNLGSVPEFCDRTILVKGTVLSHGPTETTFTRKNLEAAFGGVLRHFTLEGEALHEDADARAITIFTDDERPFVQYGDKTQRTDGNS